MGDGRFQPVLTCVRGEEGDGRLMDLHSNTVQPIFQLVDVAFEVFRIYIHLVMLGNNSEVVSI